MLKIHDRIQLCYKAFKKQRNGRKDKIQCAYFGFETEEAAMKWLLFVKRRYSTFDIRATVREGDRLECPFEVKVWEFPELMPLVFDCASRVLSQEAEAIADAA